MDTIGLQRHGDVLVATIDHPDSVVNAVDGRLHHDLGELFRTLKTEGSARAVVLIGTGRAFSAGVEVPMNRQADELLEVACHEDNNDLEHLRDVRDEFRRQRQEN